MSTKSDRWRIRQLHIWRATMLTALVACPVRAVATLGEDTASVQADRIHMRGALMRVAAPGLYTVHEIRASAGAMVREYISAGGTVFAVAWEGPWLPDLRQLLGGYFDHYLHAAQAIRARRKLRGPVRIQEPGLVMRLRGHPRAFQGSAYDPRLVPQGVDPETLR